MAAAAGGLYLWGHFTHDDHKRETGFLAIEAAVNATAASYALKYAFGRERPLQDHYHGQLLERRRFVSLRARRGGMGDCRRDRARIPQPVRESCELRNGGSYRRGAHRCQAAFSDGRAHWKHARMVCGTTSVSPASRSRSRRRRLANLRGIERRESCETSCAHWVALRGTR